MFLPVNLFLANLTHWAKRVVELVVSDLSKFETNAEAISKPAAFTTERQVFPAKFVKLVFIFITSIHLLYISYTKYFEKMIKELMRFFHAAKLLHKAYLPELPINTGKCSNAEKGKNKGVGG